MVTWTELDTENQRMDHIFHTLALESEHHSGHDPVDPEPEPGQVEDDEEEVPAVPAADESKPLFTDGSGYNVFFNEHTRALDIHIEIGSFGFFGMPRLPRRSSRRPSSYSAVFAYGIRLHGLHDEQHPRVRSEPTTSSGLTLSICQPGTRRKAGRR